ncbi:MAG TPA: efflux transporter outer membrane subunit [Burkholderiaceae bacterium]|nr:efflux transporter outer membrane subunit [Burkholderiaceae bacterium]
MTRAVYLSSLVSMTALVAGCAVGPDYARPDVDLPAQFKQQAVTSDWKPAQPADDMARGEWWRVFGDTELDALMIQVARANQDLRAAQARYQQAAALARQARAALFPLATANASATRGTSGGGNTRVSTTQQVGAALDWEIDVWGRIRRGVESNTANAQATQADLAATRLSLQAELAQNYFALRIADAQRALLEESIGAYERSLALTKNRYAAGIVTRADVAQAQTQLLSTRAQAIDLGLQRTQLEHAIAILVGRAPSELSLAATPFALSVPEIPAALPATLLERRPDIAAAERRVAAANAQIGVARAAYFPSLVLNASGGYRGLSASDLFSLPNRFWSLGPSLVATLFDAGERRAVEERATAAYDESVALYRGAVLTALREVEDALAAVRLLNEEAAVQAQAVDAARESLALATNQYKAGTVGFLNVLTAQATELTARRTALDIAGRRYTATVQLIRALGGGWTSAAEAVADAS